MHQRQSQTAPPVGKVAGTLAASTAGTRGQRGAAGATGHAGEVCGHEWAPPHAEDGWTAIGQRSGVSLGRLAAVPDAGTLPPLTVVYGGGAQFGIAYGLGVADALLAMGVPLRQVDALGISAGSWVAACLATGVTHEVLHELPQVRVPNLRPGVLRRISRAVFGGAQDARVRVAAVQLPTLRRRILSSAHFPLADLVAASSSVPGVFAPSPVGRWLYIDGMSRPGMAADQAPAARHLLVVAPLAGPMFGPGGRLMEQLLAREMRRWVQSTGGSVHLIRPNSTIIRLVRHPLDLFDQRRAREVYPMAFEQTIRLLRTRPALAQLAMADSSSNQTVSPPLAG